MRVTLAALALVLALPVAAEELFVPMVAQKQGLEGSWWNTEVWITNTTSTTGSYAVVFLPAGQANPEGLREEPIGEDLPPGATVYRDDLVPQGGSGALRLVTSPGVVVFGRVFNSAGRGSVGEAKLALPKSAALRPGEVGHLIGLRRTPQFRTNLGFFNPSPDAGTVHVRLLGPGGEELGEASYKVAPGESIQLDDALHGFEVNRGENLRAEVSGTVPLFAFASVVDSRSGAPTLVPPLR
jgi:hypothetical protein